eukprot:gene5133-34939_t
MKPVEAIGEFNPGGAYKATVGLDLGSGQKLKLIHASGTGVQGFEYGKKNWTIGSMTNKDSFFEFRSDLDVGKLKVRQNIPAGNFKLAPSPICTLATKPKTVGKFKDEYELVYDFMTKTGKATEFLEYKGAHSVKVTADTKTGAAGASVKLQTKVKKPWCKLVGVSSSSKTGPVAFYEAEPYTCLALKGEYTVKKQELASTFEIKMKADSKTKLKVDARIGKAGILKPALGFKITFDMK